MFTLSIRYRGQDFLPWHTPFQGGAMPEYSSRAAALSHREYLVLQYSDREF